MSVTFYIAKADAGRLMLDYDDAEPSENYANGNAANLLRAVGIASEPDGVIEAVEVPIVLRSALRALNTRAGRAPLIREPSDNGNRPRSGPRVIDFGTDEDYATRALGRFVGLLKRASELGRIVYWG